MYYGSMIFLLPAIIIAFYAQIKVSSAFAAYSKIRNSRGLTGAEAAKILLESSGIYDVSIEQVRGSFTDHYDPRSKVLRLSETVYNKTSIAAVSVAAHETGHAIQDDQEYAFLKLRSLLVPAANIGSQFAFPLVILGLFLCGMQMLSTGYLFMDIGIIIFSLAVLFYIITLPVEFNASSRAVAMLTDNNIISEEESKSAKKVLSAAALTYVASAAMAVANLLRLLAIAGSGRRR